MNRQRWVRHSVAYLANQLQRQGYDVSASTVYRLLDELEYSLKANRKRFTGPPHPDRDRQFEYLSSQRRLFNILGDPVISVDGKKKELLGNFKNPGRVWCRQAAAVNAHDFLDDALGRVAPYGVYEPRRDRGWVYVGLSAETAEFAVDAIARWWRDEGRWAYRQADELLVLADAGGSNSCRARLWKQQVQEKLADRWGLRVTVCHYPRGASKWNPVEHRLFSRISINWAGQPLRDLATLLACIRGTTTESGVAVKGTVLRRSYQEGIRISDEEMQSLCLHAHSVCPQWNYTIKPHWTMY
jgi:hypothetical protein